MKYLLKPILMLIPLIIVLSIATILSILILPFYLLHIIISILWHFDLHVLDFSYRADQYSPYRPTPMHCIWYGVFIDTDIYYYYKDKINMFKTIINKIYESIR